MQQWRGGHSGLVGHVSLLVEWFGRGKQFERLRRHLLERRERRRERRSKQLERLFE
jgi:hypothetical protein